MLGDVNRLAHAVGIPTADAFSLFKHFNPGQFLPARAARIEAGQFTSPSFEIAMARKDVRLMLEAAGEGPLVVLPGVARAMDRALEQGLGKSDYAVFARPSD